MALKKEPGSFGFGFDCKIKPYFTWNCTHSSPRSPRKRSVLRDEMKVEWKTVLEPSWCGHSSRGLPCGEGRTFLSKSHNVLFFLNLPDNTEQNDSEENIQTRIIPISGFTYIPAHILVFYGYCTAMLDS